MLATLTDVAIADTVKRYCDSVMEGKTVAGKLVKAAVARYLNDYQNRRNEIGRFSAHSAIRAIRFASTLRHFQGRSDRFLLSDSQTFCFWNIFGWQRRNEEGEWVRRFRSVYKEVARKNGKTTEAGAIANYMFAGDGEPGADVYTLATRFDQAFDTWRVGQMMMKSADPIEGVRYMARSMTYGTCRSQPLNADGPGLHGKHPHCPVVDELHAHATAEVHDAMATGIGSRRQPILYEITTAGSDEMSICGIVHGYSQKVVENTLKDDSKFVFIAAVDDADDPLEDESCWKKANPHLGVSLNIEAIRDAVRMARETPTQRNEVLRLHFNVWTNAATAMFDMKDWNACSDAVIPEKLRGRRCFGGLDLSKTGDFTAFTLVFPPVPSDPLWSVICLLWLPKDTINRTIGDHRRMLDYWVRAGLLEPCFGRTIDYALVRSRIEALGKMYKIQAIAYDPHEASETAELLTASGFQMTEFAQNYYNYNEPTLKVIELVQDRKIAHGGHEALKWMASNCSPKVRMDLMMPDKPDRLKTVKRIDGIVAMIMAVGRSIMADNQTQSYAVSTN